MSIVRFAADPSLVRVAIRKVKSGWSAEVSSRSGMRSVWMRFDENPMLAVKRALELAVSEHLPGVDPDLDFTYEHPFGLEGKSARGLP